MLIKVLFSDNTSQIERAGPILTSVLTTVCRTLMAHRSIAKYCYVLAMLLQSCTEPQHRVCALLSLATSWLNLLALLLRQNDLAFVLGGIFPPEFPLPLPVPSVLLKAVAHAPTLVVVFAPICSGSFTSLTKRRRCLQQCSRS
jgi:hypothetical protein